VSAELSAAGKALAAACEAVRPGTAADAIGAGSAGGPPGGNGIVPAFVASPSSTAEASALLRAAAEHDLAVVPRGSGSRLGWGAQVSRCDVVVDMLAMGAVVEHAAGDLVARVQAGARVADVAAVLAASGQEIALDVPPSATIGGVLADALAGPRRLRYGTPRDLLIGITVVRADGTVARSGGKVVKNVAGYDIGKLFTGSAGTLGLITEATFRLHPLPAARAWVTAAVAGTAPRVPATVSAVVAAAANSPLVASAVEVHRAAPDAPWDVGVLLEGSADGVAARAEQMKGLLATALRSGKGASASDCAGSQGMDAEIPAPASTAPDWWGGIPSPDGGAGHTLLRVSFWVSALGQVLDAVDAAARETGLRPAVRGPAGAGVLYVTLPPGQPQAPGDWPGESTTAGRAGETAARFVGLVRASIPAGRGAAVVLTAPEAVRAALGNPALGGAGGLAGDVPGRALMRAVKDQFDPGHRMAPGRFPA
jgi:glycolate oxidase FAD binding subunit